MLYYPARVARAHDEKPRAAKNDDSLVLSAKDVIIGCASGDANAFFLLRGKCLLWQRSECLEQSNEGKSSHAFAACATAHSHPCERD